tara:strand:- start:741 stop:1070 length:330 start_codon:yes stop_codon:yes gene_type:complete
MTTMATIYTVLISVFTALTSAKAWDFWTKRMQTRSGIVHKQQDAHVQEQIDFRSTLQQQIIQLQQRLDAKDDEIRKLHAELRSVTEEMATLRGKLEVLSSSELQHHMGG